MKKLLTLCLLLCGCGKVIAQGPPVVPVPNCCNVTLASDFATVVVETFDNSTGNYALDLKLPEPITVDSLQGWISYYGLNGRCGDGDEGNTAVIGGLNTDAGPLAIWDIQARGEAPVNQAISASYPGGVNIKSLSLTLYDDLCHPTDFRIVATLHRKKEELK